MFKPSDVHLGRVLGQIETLSAFGRTADGGVTRLTFSEAHQQATVTAAGWMAEAGLQVTFDKWGNLYGRTPGLDDVPSVLTGSHLDSVPNGGNYDGPLGVLSLLEAVRMIVERGITLRHPLEVISFIDEEGARFGGLMGSSLATGKLDDAAVGAIMDEDGLRYLDVLAGVRLPYPADHAADLRGRVAAYIELHIEQGKRLEKAGMRIGLVTSIAGTNSMRLRFTGQADHAGATDYADRRDSLLAAAEVIVALRRMGQADFAERGRVTVGSINVKPNTGNVVAGETLFSIDFRSADDITTAQMRAAIDGLLSEISAKQGVSWEIVGAQSIPAAVAPDVIRDAVAGGAKDAGVAHKDLISWAAHDAMRLADIAPSGMIFVPCRDGRSHTPDEFTKAEDIAAGVAVLANALLRLAG